MPVSCRSGAAWLTGRNIVWRLHQLEESCSPGPNVSCLIHQSLVLVPPWGSPSPQTSPSFSSRWFLFHLHIGSVFLKPSIETIKPKDLLALCSPADCVPAQPFLKNPILFLGTYRKISQVKLCRKLHFGNIFFFIVPSPISRYCYSWCFDLMP